MTHIVFQHWRGVQPEPRFVPPALLEVPYVPPTANEEPIPPFEPPLAAALDPVQLPHFQPRDGPNLPERPQTPYEAPPEHGADWVGERPFREGLPELHVPALEPVPDFKLPRLPQAPSPLVRA